MHEIITRPASLPADRNPALVYLSRIRASSRRTQTTALNNIAGELSNGKLSAEQFPWHLLRYQHTEAIRARLMDIPEYSPATVNRYLSALRGVLKAARRLGLMTSEEYGGAVDIENIKYEAPETGRMLTPDEVAALIQVCLLEASDIGVRDAAMIALMYVTGARRFEVAKMQAADFEVASGKVVIVYGKRNKSRTSYIDGNAKAHMMRWLKIRGTTPGALFLAFDKHGNATNKALNPQTVYDMLQRRGKQAGLEQFSPHDLRRTAISELLDREVDIATVAKIVGHENLDTTRRYDKRGEKSKQAATKVFDSPI